MMVACILEILTTFNELFTFTWYITIEVIVISTYIALMLLFLIIYNAPCRNKRDQVSNYNRVAIDHSNSSSLANDDSVNGPLNEKPLLRLGLGAKKLDDLENQKKGHKVTKYADTDEEVDKTRRKETDESNIPVENQAEIDLLNQFITALKQEGLLLTKDEKKGIVETRNKILKEQESEKQQEKA